MNIIETPKRGSTPHHRATGPIITVVIDTAITIDVLKWCTDNLAHRRLQTGADHARADAPSRQLSIPATDTLTNSLNHQPELSPPANQVTNRLKGYRAPALTASASAKSP